MVMSTPSSTVYQQTCFRQLRCSLLTTSLQLTMREFIRDTEETNLAGALPFSSVPFGFTFCCHLGMILSYLFSPAARFFPCIPKQHILSPT